MCIRLHVRLRHSNVTSSGKAALTCWGELSGSLSSHCTSSSVSMALWLSSQAALTELGLLAPSTVPGPSKTLGSNPTPPYLGVWGRLHPAPLWGRGGCGAGWVQTAQEQRQQEMAQGGRGRESWERKRLTASQEASPPNRKQVGGWAELPEMGGGGPGPVAGLATGPAMDPAQPQPTGARGAAGGLQGGSAASREGSAAPLRPL